MITTNTKQGERERASAPEEASIIIITTTTTTTYKYSIWKRPPRQSVSRDRRGSRKHQLNFTSSKAMRHHHHHHHHLFLVLLLFLGTLFEPFLWSSSSSSGVGVAAYKVKHTTDPSFECSGCARTRLIGCFNNLCSYRCYRSCTNGTGVVIGKFSEVLEHLLIDNSFLF